MIMEVAIGGLFGSMLRYHLAKIAHKRIIGTWIANITGAILLGFLVRLHMQGQLADSMWYMLGVGFCGAYTTFSTFGNETLDLVLNKNILKAFIYVASSIIVSLLTVYVIYHA